MEEKGMEGEGREWNGREGKPHTYMMCKILIALVPSTWSTKNGNFLIPTVAINSEDQGSPGGAITPGVVPAPPVRMILYFQCVREGYLMS